MQYSTINYNDIDLGNRIDAEYFQPNYLHIENKLISKNTKPLNEFCNITGSAFYPAATHLYEIGDMPFIRCVDCINYPAITKKQNNSFEKIPRYFADEYKNVKRLKKGEIVITKVGTTCFASIIHDIDEVALSRTVLGLKRIKNIDPYYLLAFLRSKYGFLQLYRERELTIQFQLTLERVGTILIYKPLNTSFELLVSKIIKKYESQKNISESLFDEAEKFLLTELGLENWKPKHKLTFVKNYFEAEKVDRFDAEYFQPKFDEIVKAIKNCQGGFDTLGKLATIKKCIEVGSNEYLNEGIPFIRVSNISPFEIKNKKYISKELYNELKSHQPQKGEILLSKDATPGIAYFLHGNSVKMIPSGGILRIKIKSTKIIPEYLSLVLNSLIVKEQINRDVGGSVILHWRPDQVKNTLIPILKDNKQKIIMNKITKSTDLRQKSKTLLQIAKKGVEMAIEKDENIAKEWIKKEIDKLGVKINA